MRNMVDTNIVDDIDECNFFDQIDDLLDFPNNDVDTGVFGTAAINCSPFPPFWSDHSPDFSAAHSYTASDLATELSVPYEDIVQLEWLSTFVEDSFSGGGLTLDQVQSTSPTKDSFPNQFQTSSPISVLESSSSSACSKGKTLPVCHEKRARSKRPRPATFTPRAAIHLIAPASSSASGTSYHPFSNASSEPENFAESYSDKAVENQKKKRKIKILPPSGGQKSTSCNQNENPNSATVRKCKHCEITKTPQWRAGPLGPKTLCNACGVRYKSGRLFPEYRPAASPTFVPSIHSNSHKKVVEMRSIKPMEPENSVFKATAPSACLVDLGPKTNLSPAYI